MSPQGPAPAPQPRYFRPGQFLFRENEASRSVFLIKKGTISIRKTKKDGQIELARIYSNEIIGELSFFDRSPRSASAVALTEVEAQEIPFAALERILAAVPEYFKTIMASVADRLRRADDTIRRLQTELIEEQCATSGDEFSAADALAALERPDGGESPEETGNGAVDAPPDSAADPEE